MKSLLSVINGLAIVKNSKGDKVEQKQARAIKSDLIDGFVKQFVSDGFEIMYDEKNSPVIVFDNGLAVGFDFVVKKLDGVLFAEKQEKAE